jgi:GNAT superfamily N-acetyltransferase
MERVYFDTQRWLIEHLFGWRGNDVEKSKFAEFYDEPNSFVIVHDALDVGWLTLVRAKDAFALEGIYIDEPYQRRGTGTHFIQLLTNEAAEAGVPLLLSTAKINPARELYARLGFQEIREDEFKVYMRSDFTAERGSG